MRCEDFREISDSYLMGELLVETNHEVVRHLEKCESCRKELELQKAFREKLRSAVAGALGARPDPDFAARLRSQLINNVNSKDAQPRSWSGAFSLKTLTATFASVLVVAAMTAFVLLAGNKTGAPSAPAETVQDTGAAPTADMTSMWQKIAYQAIGDHRHCGLEKTKYWRENAYRETPVKANFRENILQKASFNTSEPVKLLHVHDCVYDNRNFTHAVLQIGDRTVSVLLTETELATETNKSNRSGEPNSAITCQKQTGFQVASFAGSNKAVFVISDLSEAENLNLARSLSNVMNS